MKKIVLETVVLSMIFVHSVCATPPIIPSYQFLNTCPKDKPFVRYRGPYVSTECIGCDFPETIVIRAGHEKDFEICENRETFVAGGNVDGGYKSRLKNCPNDMPLQTEQGCSSCSFQGEVYGKHLTKEMCSLCPNAFYYQRGEYGYCVHVQCPPGNPMAFRYNTCDLLEEFPDFKWVCEGCNSRYIRFLKEECDKCSNRIFIDGKCMFIDNPYVDRPVMARYIPEKIMFDGKEHEGPLDCNEKVGFYSCFDETTQFITSKEECDKCQNRVYENGECRLK